MSRIGESRILIVDDVKANVDVLVASLRDQYKLSVALNGEAALGNIEKHPPDLVLLDIIMPGIDGFEVCRRMRADERFRDIPVMFLSSLEDVQNKAAAFEAGGNDYVTKPFDIREVKVRVKSLLEARAFAHEEKARVAAERKAEMLGARNTLIFALAKLAESRDSDTGAHLERIAEFSGILATALKKSLSGLTDEWIANLQLASSLHDIGKVGVPDRVLCKPGPLTEEERQVIQTHPKIGADALQAILDRQRDDELLQTARNIAASHHERWDGKGYPSGIRGEEIPLEARIVSVVDVYDALTSARVYKPAMSHEKAIELIRSGRGTQFDPALIDLIDDCEAKFDLARAQFSDAPPPAAPPSSA